MHSESIFIRSYPSAHSCAQFTCMCMGSLVLWFTKFNDLKRQQLKTKPQNHLRFVFCSVGLPLWPGEGKTREAPPCSLGGRKGKLLSVHHLSMKVNHRRQRFTLVHRITVSWRKAFTFDCQLKFGSDKPNEYCGMMIKS